jgi:hypothetical protein
MVLANPDIASWLAAATIPIKAILATLRTSARLTALYAMLQLRQFSTWPDPYLKNMVKNSFDELFLIINVASSKYHHVHKKSRI